MVKASTAPQHIRIDVGGGLHTAVDIYRPAEVPERPVVAFAFPGGGYSRAYYDIRHDGDAYSQAAFHVARGWIVVTCDHLGVGDSDQPDPSTLTIEALAAANDATVRAVLTKLDVKPGLVVGIGSRWAVAYNRRPGPTPNLRRHRHPRVQRDSHRDAVP